MNLSDGLVLYYYHHSFSSQKVIMALTEKRIPFTKKIIHITNGEQHQPWFLEINPRGEVPVLQDGIKLIPDSVRIIDYLEDNFSNGEHSRLIPANLDLDVKQKVITLRNEIDKLPINLITMGSFFNNEFCSNARYPFISFMRRHFKVDVAKSSYLLRQHAAKNPEMCDILIQKANNQDDMLKIVTNRSEYQNILDQVSAFLEKVEIQLRINRENGINWLCCNKFTLADISLTIFLDRLSRLGFADYFWKNRNYINIEKYYQRVQQRESYKQAIPTVMTDVKLLMKTKAYLIIGFLTIVTVVVGSFVYLKNN